MNNTRKEYTPSGYHNHKRPVYSHQQIAMLYFPDIQPDSASRQLRRWINRDPDLLSDLREAGYIKGQKVFNPVQTAILMDHLGDPGNWRLK